MGDNSTVHPGLIVTQCDMMRMFFWQHCVTVLMSWEL